MALACTRCKGFDMTLMFLNGADKGAVAAALEGGRLRARGAPAEQCAELAAKYGL